MAFSRVLSAAIWGLHVKKIHVETDISNGLPLFQMVGYLSSEVREASERVRTAIRNSGIQMPPRRIVVNLAPAVLRKQGTWFDLAIALSLLEGMELFPKGKLEGILVVGELGLDGGVRKVAGILPIVLYAKEQGFHTCMLPRDNASEGRLAEGIRILGVGSLREAVAYLRGNLEGFKEKAEEKRTEEKKIEKETNQFVNDFREVQGQEIVKRAVEVSVAGGHNLLLLGPPGSGKSMIAARIPTILPELTREEQIEITKIYSVLGKLNTEHPLLEARPFRSVHHTVTKTTLAGGGRIPAPGEISLAHKGVLFLDEMAEFQKAVLEVLRQPMEEKEIEIQRVQASCVFPADFMLVGAMNPCPCGNYPDEETCVCTPHQIRTYLGKISQPMLDRMDVCIETPKLSYEVLRRKEEGESSRMIRERVQRTRDIQKERYREKEFLVNARLKPKDLEEFCHLGPVEEEVMKQAFKKLDLTARTYHKILKVARTIADMDESEKISAVHLKEAIGYRMLDKRYWK